MSPLEKKNNDENKLKRKTTTPLYEPDYERDSCGVGFIARLDAEPSHQIVEDATQILINLEHRGALGGDKSTGDGAGILCQIPDLFLREACSEIGIELPDFGEYASGLIFLPQVRHLAERCINAIEKIIEEEGGNVLGWRKVPINPNCIGEFARSNQPEIKQLFFSRGSIPKNNFDIKIYVIRRMIEKEIYGWHYSEVKQFFIPSLSAKTIVYKGLFTGTQLKNFYLDFQNEKFKSAFAIVHQRYSTNTLPTWTLAQPFRFLAHNGEINTLKGNISRMRSREAVMESKLLGEDIEKIKPVILEWGSDSSIFDNVLELLVTAGRSLPHALMMMIPEAWGTKYHISADKRAFYEYHSAFMEPWDGPAAMVVTDGRYIGATLDRNGLRPARYTITTDGLIVLASETGVLEIPANKVQSKGRLQPGKMFLVDLVQHRVVPDNEIKAKISRQKPYRRWVKYNSIELQNLFTPIKTPRENPDVLLQKQHAFGWTSEEIKIVISPMASQGQEPVGSMGNDAAIAVLSERPQILFSYFKQLFAQVTNPAIDPLREELVMSLRSYLGRERNLLDETPEHARRLLLRHPILTREDMYRLRNANHPDLVIGEINSLFTVNGNAEASLKKGLDSVFEQADKLINNGATVIILTDRKMDKNNAPIPILLAVSGLHQHLIRKGIRTKAGIIAETGEPREVIHFALMSGYGANAVCPHVAFSTVRELTESKMLERDLSPDEALDHYINAIKKGLLKTFSRMGISTIRSFFGAQIFEAIGLGKEVVDKYFTGTVSRIGGIGLKEIAEETLARHKKAFPEHGNPSPLLDVGGAYHVRENGERHLFSPEAIYKLQQSVRNNDYKVFKEYTKIIDNQSAGKVTLRSLFTFNKIRKPIPINEVEPVESIVKRFVSAAMSFGSISKETHETIAIAMNRLGGRSNSGEGGEDPLRFNPLPDGNSLNSKIKQVASGRFGVTAEYLISAEELQIKIAQGAKPGEGGQLPGHKVSKEIAKVRHTMPGVTLISPPPHHDIYSIEDIAQLIFDLKAVNPKAKVSVKLVSEVGVGTVACGVAKANADLVTISGYDGGTGASPWTAIKHAGLPWELGLAEVHQMLVANKLRDKIKVQVDGQLKTGRDLAIAALMGAEEFGFGTTILVSLGCVMMRKCHLNTCPVGVGTQNPALRSRFTGKPEYVECFLRFIAQELREYMAELGFKTINEMVGHSELLSAATNINHPKAAKLDFSPLFTNTLPTTTSFCSVGQITIDNSFNTELIKLAEDALNDKKPVSIELPIRNVHRAVGATLSGEIVKKYGAKGLRENTISLSFKGSAGQSLGAFLAPGITIKVEGDANDYLGKGLSGGKIIVIPPLDAKFIPEENIIVGNVVLYGATSGEVYIYGIAGERFAVRNSGAKAVVEGVGDHGCEYMTGGVVVVLGQTGNNFAAGMSGGIAYIFDETQLFDTRCNLDMVDLETVWMKEDQNQLREMIEKHFYYTNSKKAKMILENWDALLPLFVKVMPMDYKIALEKMRLAEDIDRETISATEEVYHG